MTDTSRGEDRFELALAGLGEPLADVARVFRDNFRTRHPDRSLDALGADVEGVARLVALSEFAGDTLLRDPDAMGDRVGTRGILDGIGSPGAKGDSRDAVMRDLRRFRNRGLLRVLWHELVQCGEVSDSLAALSTLAERCIETALASATAMAERRFGRIVEQDGRVALPLILAMGKLGGRELNLSSDIDIVFVHDGSGESDGPRRLSAHEYFARVARETVTLLDEVTADGFVYRVDTRLRPFGHSGPPVVSVDALERYLIEHGRDWERYAYVKARPVAVDPESEPARRLVGDIIVPFVYRRYLDYGIFESLRDMHGRIAGEVARRELKDNVKLGPGGIREIEFIVQSLQLLRGGNVAALRTPELRTAVLAAVDDRDFSDADANELLAAYDVLRRIENVLQGMRDRQTHDLPPVGLDRDRLVAATGRNSWTDFLAWTEAAREVVRRQFDDIGIRDSERQNRDERLIRLESLWAARADARAWQETLLSIGFAEAAAGGVSAELADFRAAAAVRNMDTAAAPRLKRFIANLLLALTGQDNAAEVLRRVLGVAESVIRRSAYLALLNENPTALERVVGLCAQSIYLSRELRQYPALLDELIDDRLFGAAPTRARLEADFLAELERIEPGDAEAKVAALAEFRRSALFRIAVADISGRMPLMKVSDRLTDVAELILNEALETVSGDLEAQYGRPCCSVDGRSRRADFGVIAYGKLAGYELSYSSDLDLVFIHDSRGSDQKTDGERSIDNAVFFGRLVRRLVHLLTTQTAYGALYDIDTRLRPSGRSGLLVTGLDAFRKYQEQNAWTWEHQAMLRSRPVAGGQRIATAFEAVRRDTLTKSAGRDALAREVASMRRKMRRALDRSDATRFDMKNGRGGIGDIEFLVQFLVLAHANDHPTLIRYPDIVRQLEALDGTGTLEPDVAGRLAELYRELRERAHRLALDERDAFADPASLDDARAFVIRQWKAVFDDEAP